MATRIALNTIGERIPLACRMMLYSIVILSLTSNVIIIDRYGKMLDDLIHKALTDTSSDVSLYLKD